MCDLGHYTPRHFIAQEFLPPEVFDRFGAGALYTFIDVRVLITADQVRDFFGAVVTGNNWHRGGLLRYRGYRPDRYYTDRGTDPTGKGSQHRFGRAFDCDVAGCSADFVRDVIQRHPLLFPYIRRIELGVAWLHFDVMNTPHDGIHFFQP